jgi:hypothetical protein
MSTVLYKQGNRVAFNLIVFVKLLINFIISNLLALQIVESISLQQLLEYCLSDIELPLHQSLMYTMLSLYIKALKVVKVILQHHLLNSSRLCLTADSWSTSNSNSYLSIIVYWTDTM